MLSKENCLLFLGKNVRLERIVGVIIDERFGVLKEVNDTELILERINREGKAYIQIYDLASLTGIREAY